MKFAYRRYNQQPAPGFPDGAVYRPRIPIVVRGDHGEIGFEALVDTGSDQTIFPARGVEDFGVRLDRSATSHVRALHGQPDTLILGKNVRLALFLNGHALQ